MDEAQSQALTQNLIPPNDTLFQTKAVDFVLNQIILSYSDVT